jgi:hypothetical protein
LAAIAAHLADVGNTEIPAIEADHILSMHLNQEAAERVVGARYPQVNVFCEKVSNRLTEKFRRFSGTASVALEIRVSQDRAEGLEQRLQLYVDAITALLADSRGEWEEGVYYSGAYEVTFGGARQGGKHFVQSAKISVDLDVSHE